MSACAGWRRRSPGFRQAGSCCDRRHVCLRRLAAALARIPTGGILLRQAACLLALADGGGHQDSDRRDPVATGGMSVCLGWRRRSPGFRQAGSCCDRRHVCLRRLAAALARIPTGGILLRQAACLLALAGGGARQDSDRRDPVATGGMSVCLGWRRRSPGFRQAGSCCDRRHVCLLWRAAALARIPTGGILLRQAACLLAQVGGGAHQDSDRRDPVATGGMSACAGWRRRSPGFRQAGSCCDRRHVCLLSLTAAVTRIPTGGILLRQAACLLPHAGGGAHQDSDRRDPVATGGMSACAGWRRRSPGFRQAGSCCDRRHVCLRRLAAALARIPTGGILLRQAACLLALADGGAHQDSDRRDPVATGGMSACSGWRRRSPGFRQAGSCCDRRHVCLRRLAAALTRIPTGGILLRQAACLLAQAGGGAHQDSDRRDPVATGGMSACSRWRRRSPGFRQAGSCCDRRHVCLFRLAAALTRIPTGGILLRQAACLLAHAGGGAHQDSDRRDPVATGGMSACSR